ncbi:hypothetical protein TNCV_866831 [Trichonephila clavipes]|nr:hypothetical protein TNCV_866831 [Trichonephila clavipes]
MARPTERPSKVAAGGTSQQTSERVVMHQRIFSFPATYLRRGIGRGGPVAFPPRSSIPCVLLGTPKIVCVFDARGYSGGSYGGMVVASADTDSTPDSFEQMKSYEPF